MGRIFAAGLFLFILLQIAVSAHEGATGMVKMRMDAMSAISKNMKVIAAILNNKQAGDGELLANLAREIGDHAGNFPSHFTDEKVDPISEAAPAIWQKPAKFQELSDALASHAGDFSDQANSGAEPGELNQVFQKMAGTCKACHEVYRIKK